MLGVDELPSYPFYHHRLPSNTSLSPSTHERWIRLLTIRPSPNFSSPMLCFLRDHPLEEAPQYEALSYTWGAKHPVNRVWINGGTLDVRANLFTALRHLRYPDRDRLLWVDAVCINQESVDERNRTVRFMRDIYACAAGGVVVWLGKEGDDTHLVQNFLDRLIEDFKQKDFAGKVWMARFRTLDVSTCGIPYLSDPGYRALYNLLLTPWSSRVWIVQEVATAPRDPEIRVLRGSHSFSMERIAMALSLIYKYELERGLGYKYPARFATLWGERISQKDNPHLIDVVKRNWLTYAGDERDKIYGLGGLAADISLNIDYDPQITAVDVFTDFARICISRYNNLAILGALSSGFEGRRAGLPSWAPDWTVWDEHTFLFISPQPDAEGRGFMHFTASKEHSSSCNPPPTFSGEGETHLQVEGCIIDTIIDVGKVFPSSGSVNEILEFFRRSE